MKPVQRTNTVCLASPGLPADRAAERRQTCWSGRLVGLAMARLIDLNDRIVIESSAVNNREPPSFSVSNASPVDISFLQYPAGQQECRFILIPSLDGANGLPHSPARAATCSINQMSTGPNHCCGVLTAILFPSWGQWQIFAHAVQRHGC